MKQTDEAENGQAPKDRQNLQRRQTLEEELRQVRRRLAFYETLVDELPMPIFAKDRESRFCLFNKAYEKFFSVRREDLLGLTVMDLDYLSPEERARYQAEDTAHVGSVDEKHYSTAFDCAHGIRQTLYWTRGIRVPSTDEVARIGAIVDISKEWRLRLKLGQKIRELREAKEKLQYLSRTDALTGLPNRRPFEEMLEQCMVMAQRYGYPFALLMLDLDHFKQVNDRFGHAEGDKVLRMCANVLHNNRRSEDLPARFGGEEFVLLLPGSTLEGARQLAEIVRQATCERVLLPDGSEMTVSIGVVQYHEGESSEDFLQRADEALYQAKRTGRNRVCG